MVLSFCVYFFNHRSVVMYMMYMSSPIPLVSNCMNHVGLDCEPDMICHLILKLTNFNIAFSMQ